MVALSDPKMSFHTNSGTGNHAGLPRLFAKADTNSCEFFNDDVNVVSGHFGLAQKKPNLIVNNLRSHPIQHALDLIVLNGMNNQAR